MIPSSSSVMVISRLPERAVSSAASLIRFARSAPVKPGGWPASASRAICFSRGLGRGGSGGVLLRQRLAAGVDLEDLLAAATIGPVDDDLAVEAPRAQQR